MTAAVKWQLRFYPQLCSVASAVLSALFLSSLRGVYVQSLLATGQELVMSNFTISRLADVHGSVWICSQFGQASSCTSVEADKWQHWWSFYPLCLCLCTNRRVYWLHALRWKATSPSNLDSEYFPKIPPVLRPYVRQDLWMAMINRV